MDSDYTTIYIDEGLHIQFYGITERYAGTGVGDKWMDRTLPRWKHRIDNTMSSHP